MLTNHFSHSSVLELHSGAQWYKADLHLHTPASDDFKGNREDTTPKDIVETAIDKGLHLIAVTDHNTVDWCDAVREAAKGTELVVFPGVEVSTSQGHVLAIFDLDAQKRDLERFLDRVEIPPDKFGDLEHSSPLTIGEVSRAISEFKGVAIAAHADGKRGFLKTIPIPQHKESAYKSEDLWAMEILDAELRDKHQSGECYPPRRMTCLQFSDSHELGKDMGRRSTFLKMGEKNIDGLKLALLDPSIRVAFTENELPDTEFSILGMWVTNGFLDGQQMRFNEGVNCLIGDTGSGKSLSLELIRFALGQQPGVYKIQEEVDSLLKQQLTSAGMVHVMLRISASKYLIERTLGSSPSSPTVKRIEEDGSLTRMEVSNIREFFPIKSFSQSEIIEFAREESVRLSLTDDLIEISEERISIDQIKGDLRRNAANLIADEETESHIRREVASRPTLEEDLARVEEVLPQDRLKEQELWGIEDEMLNIANEQIESLPTKLEDSMSGLIQLPEWGNILEGLPNRALLDELEKAFQNWQFQVRNSQQELMNNLSVLIKTNEVVRMAWAPRFENKKAEYWSLLESLDTGGKGFASLAEYRQDIKDQIARLDEREHELHQELLPRIAELRVERDRLLTELQLHRRSMTGKREKKAEDLTAKLKQNVRLRVHARKNNEQFTELLSAIAVGSRLGTSNIELLCTGHPVPFVKKMLSNDFDELAAEQGVSESKLEALWNTILERNKLSELYELQLVDVDDVIRVQLEVEQGEYKEIEELSHGQKCRVVLMVALAEGSFPLLVDQPEDALHAPGIEEGIVSNLRMNRGKRQCLFATRSANILVSADADQIIALEADAHRGSVKSTGSLDSFDHKTLVIYHVEGGDEALRRRNSMYTLSQFAFDED